MTEIADSVLSARYYAENENCWEDVCRRVSNYIGNNDSEKQTFFKLMSECKFIPNSPTLFNAGLPNGQLSACFVLPIEDSIEGIYKTLGEEAKIFATGGGCGANFSNLRPKNSAVKGSKGIASGVVSFMKVFDSSIDAIKQGGRRRGAKMAILNCDHPDILDFLVCKSKEGEISNCNLSVMVTDEFMDYVKKEDFEHVLCQETLNDGVKHDITVGDVWHGLVEGSWRNGEPAILFEGTINKGNKLLKLGRISCTNPCLTADMEILTDKGYVPIGTLVDKDVRVWNGEEWSWVKPFFVARNQPIYEITFSNGSVVKATADHNWFTLDGVKTTSELIPNVTKLVKWDMPIIEGSKILPEAYTYGFFCGDGGECSDGRNRIYIYPPKACCFDCEIPSSGHKCKDVDKTWSKQFVPDASYTIESRKNWLAGLIDADGTIQEENGYTITSVDKDFLMNVSKMLNTMGINVKITLCKDESVRNIKGDNYYCKPLYRLLMTKLDSYELNLPTKRLPKVNLPNRNASRFIQPVSITKIDNADVYCCTEPLRHQIIINGVLTSNCGEQPLLPYESCNLGSINLVKYVREQGDIDWDSLKEDARVCTRFLNNVIDKNSFPLKELSKMSRYTRKIGLGIMGLADLFITLRIPYDSQRALTLAGEILQTIREEAEDESHKMALETEVFPAFKKSTWEREMRNAALMTIAPTGSISLLANCSSGIEPVFNWVYERRNTVGKSFLMVHPLFEKDLKTMCAGNKQLYEDIINQVFREGTLQNVDCIPQEVKDVYKCALDISPEWHIKMQGECQKYVDASISKTINLPADTTIEDVEKIFLKAYDLGCKGVTVYRTNSRKEVVLSHGEDTIGFKDVIHDGVVYKHCNSCGHEFISNAHCATCPNCGNSFCG